MRRDNGCVCSGLGPGLGRCLIMAYPAADTFSEAETGGRQFLVPPEGGEGSPNSRRNCAALLWPPSWLEDGGLSSNGCPVR